MEEDFEKVEKEREIEKQYPEKRVDFDAERDIEKLVTSQEINEQKEKIKSELEKEIEKVKLSPQVKTQAQQQADDINRQGAQGKIKHLLDLAQTKGLAYSIEVAKKMNDAYLLDLYHDELAKNSRYKEFLE